MAATLADRGVHDGDPAPAVGYYDGADVPVYDHLAEEFSVCDRWLARSLAQHGPTALYSLCGTAAGSRDDLPPHVPPMYDKPSFIRHLDAHRVSCAGIASTPRRCAWPTPITAQDTTTSSATSARPA